MIGALLVGLLVPASVDAASEGTRAERERIRRERARAAAELDVLRAEDAEVGAALDAMTVQVRAQEESLRNAERAARAAEDEVQRAAAAEAETVGKVEALADALRDMAVQEYIAGGRGTGLPDSADLASWARRNTLAEIAVGSATATSDALAAAREDLTIARERAEQASVDAARRRDAVSSELETVRAARDEQATFAARLDARIESRLAEAASLARIDSDLSARIARDQAALAARNVGGRGNPGGARPGRVPLRTVRGITVHADIADELDDMLGAAESDGVSMGGWGYRDPEDQARLRRQNCPDPERSPSSSCRPPTARPGHSMHERGLAVDFTSGGSTLGSGSAGYRWLRANAARYGFYNLPGEPWHWSTNGN